MQLIVFFEEVVAAIFRPQPIARLVALRILAPLAILGFMSSRIAYPDDWLSDLGFRVPAISGWQQPISLPPLPSWAALAVCVALVVSGLATALGASDVKFVWR